MWGVGDVDIDDLESEVANPREEAVQRGVVDEHPREDGLAVHFDVVECGGHGGTDRALEPHRYVLHDGTGARIEALDRRCDGVTGAHTVTILHDRAGRHIAPME